MNKQSFTEWYVKYGIMVIAAIILIVVPLIKGGNVGTDPFLIERLSHSIGFFDELSFGGTVASYLWGTPLLISPAPVVGLFFLPLFLGLLTLGLLSRILSKLVNKPLLENVTLFLVVLSPSFIYAFSHLNFITVSLFLSVLSFYLFISEKYYVTSIALMLVLPLFNVVVALCTLLILFCYAFFERRDRIWLFWLVFFATAIMIGAYYGFIFSQTNVSFGVILDDGVSLSVFENYLFDLGASFGLAVFVVLLAGYGVVSRWGKKYDNLFLFFVFVLLSLFAFFKAEALVLLSLFVSYFAAIGFLQLLKNRWTTYVTKRIILFMLIFGVVFSAISQIDRLNDSEPDEFILEGLEFLGNQDPGVVLSDVSRGVWINYVGHKNVVDENYKFVSDAEERLLDVERVFASRELENVTAFIDKYEIDYIWIDEGFRDDVWQYEEEGILFVLQYTKDFNKIYDKGGVEIWRIQR